MQAFQPQAGPTHSCADLAASKQEIFRPNGRGKSLLLSRLPIVIATLGLCLLASPRAATAEDYFHGKTITYVVGQAAGGGYDRYARLLAPFLEEELGARRVVVQNLPTAAGVPALNDVYNRAPDGLFLSTMNTGLLLSQIGGLDGMEVDLARMDWIGKGSSESRVILVRADLGLASFEDLQRSGDPLRFATARFGSAAFVQTHLLREAFDLNLRVLAGFGGAEAEAALVKGEVDGIITSESNAPPLIKNGHALPLLIFGNPYDESLQDVPRWIEVARTHDQRLVAEQIDRMSQLGRLLATTPETPEPILAELRRAFAAAMENNAFIEQARQNSLEIGFLGGEAVQAMVEDFLLADDRFRKLVARTLEP
jgi:tripartite-type tricarboxylate transporter receptor subunit TctC